MSIVSSYATPEAAESLKRQRRMASITSLVIAILMVVLVAVVLGCALNDEQHLAWTERMQSLMP